MPETFITATNPQSAPRLHRLTIDRFRGIEHLEWNPSAGVNIILGGGDTGKTTVLEAISLLLSPTNSMVLAESDYWNRKVEKGFCIEGVISLPPSCGVSNQAKPSWPWQWDGQNLSVPDMGDLPLLKMSGEAVYRIQVRGTEDFELLFEIVQPNDVRDTFSVSLRRKIGLVRLGGDDKNDRDLRLVYGSALDRLISDKPWRAKILSEFSDKDIKSTLDQDAKEILDTLDKAFTAQTLPHDLGLGLVGGQGLSLNALIGLTAKRDTVDLPLSSWGSGTRRLAALEVAAQRQGESPITVVDEIERGLEPYRQRRLIAKLEKGQSQVFITTHSSTIINSAKAASLWYLDATSNIGALPSSAPVKLQQAQNPEAFLSTLAIFGEGPTEVGFVSKLLSIGVGKNYKERGVCIADATGNDNALQILEIFGKGNIKCGGFVDYEGRNPTRWKEVKKSLCGLLFQWASGCLEENILGLVPDNCLEQLINDPSGDKAGTRRRTLADRLHIDEKDFATLKGKAPDLRTLIIEAATGKVPDTIVDKDEQKVYKGHARYWFKSYNGGVELFDKCFDFGIWPALKDGLLPFVNAVRATFAIPPLEDLIRDE
jgi:putative ATP-dependent endonuclease of OLD family